MIGLFSCPSRRISRRSSARALECLVTLQSSPAEAYVLAFTAVAGLKLITFDRALKSRSNDVLVLLGLSGCGCALPECHRMKMSRVSFVSRDL
jgi:hypothetical protein